MEESTSENFYLYKLADKFSTLIKFTLELLNSKLGKCGLEHKEQTWEKHRAG